MSNQFFVNPQEDPAAEDPFVGPGDDSSREAIGASPAGGVARPANKRASVIAIGSGVVVILAFLMIYSRGGGEAEAVAKADNSSMDTTVSAQVTDNAQQEVQSILDGSAQNTDAVELPGGATAEFGSEFVDPGQLEPGVFDTTTPAGQQPAAVLDPSLPIASQPYPSGTEVTTPGVTLPTGAAVPGQVPEQSMPTMSPDATPSTGQEPATAEDGADAEIARQEALALRREAEEARIQRLKDIAAAREAEEKRLRVSTKIAEGEVKEAGVAAAGSAAPAGESSRLGATASGATANRDLSAQILPGTMVPAVLESTYSSDAEGGQVVVRLTAPLKSRSGVILPTGTQGFGTASSSGGTAGNPARVQIEINTFVTPDEQVIRGSLVGRAMDPETRSLSVAGQVNRRYGEQLLRGALSTAIGLAIASQGDDRRSIYDQPSVKDEVLRDTRERVGAVIGDDVGDEGAVRAAIRVDRGTQFFLVFGI